MTIQQPEALRLADLIEWDNTHDLRVSAAAELRRLDAVNAQLLEALEQLHRATEGVSVNNYSEEAHDIAVCKARAAIAAAKEKA
jgi:hypothetical protein